ncbi:hypothetical protein CXP40_13240 [Pseudomonas sp. YY-1]|nr:hypothetical protein CXP40_13240 [Pseudomonas sp. YY-1]
MPAQAGTQNLQITRAPDSAGVTISGLFRTSQGEPPAQDRRQAGSYSVPYSSPPGRYSPRASP